MMKRMAFILKIIALFDVLVAFCSLFISCVILKQSINFSVLVVVIFYYNICNAYLDGRKKNRLNVIRKADKIWEKNNNAFGGYNFNDRFAKSLYDYIYLKFF